MLMSKLSVTLFKFHWKSIKLPTCRHWRPVYTSAPDPLQPPQAQSLFEPEAQLATATYDSGGQLP